MNRVFLNSVFIKSNRVIPLAVVWIVCSGLSATVFAATVFAATDESGGTGANVIGDLTIAETVDDVDDVDDKDTKTTDTKTKDSKTKDTKTNGQNKSSSLFNKNDTSLLLSKPKSKSYSPFVEGQLSNAVLGLVFVLGMVLLCAWFVKRTNLVRYGQEQKLKVVSSFPLSNKEKIILVEVNGIELLLGVTGQNIRTLYAFDEQDKMRQADTNPSANAVGFSDKLKEMLERG